MHNEKSDIQKTVTSVIAQALKVDEAQIQSGSSLIRDLGAESIDFLDIVFKLEQAFGFKIAQGELFPENVQQDPRYVVDGKVTPQGIAALKQKLPHGDFARLERDPSIANVPAIFTVDAIVRFVERKLAAR